MEYHSTSLAINFRCTILEDKYFYVIENLAVVTLPLFHNVITERFVEKILYFKSHKRFELAI